MRLVFAASVYIFCFLLVACSSDHSPAPVVLLNSQPDDSTQRYDKRTYVVKRGDTLFGIAWYTENDYRDIAKYNNLSAPYSIYPGQVLKVTPPTTTSTKRPQKAESREKTGQTSTHIDERRVDRPKPPAYGGREKNVNNKKNKSVKPLTQNTKKPTRRTFPSRVERWVWPAEGKLVGLFSRDESGSKGIEISAQRGTSVHAAAGGKVVYAGSGLRGYGNLIIIKHTDALLSAYAYNDTIDVKEQQWVAAGEKIATMGDSGTDSVKLHFEVRYRGKSLDPLRYLPDNP